MLFLSFRAIDIAALQFHGPLIVGNTLCSGADMKSFERLAWGLAWRVRSAFNYSKSSTSCWQNAILSTAISSIRAKKNGNNVDKLRTHKCGVRNLGNAVICTDKMRYQNQFMAIFHVLSFIFEKKSFLTRTCFGGKESFTSRNEIVSIFQMIANIFDSLVIRILVCGCAIKALIVTLRRMRFQFGFWFRHRRIFWKWLTKYRHNAASAFIWFPFVLLCADDVRVWSWLYTILSFSSR